jgi:hypothetical protein
VVVGHLSVAGGARFRHPCYAQYIASNGRVKVKKELGRPWKEAVVGWSEVLPWNVSRVAEKNHKVFQSGQPTYGRNLHLGLSDNGAGLLRVALCSTIALKSSPLPF